MKWSVCETLSEEIEYAHDRKNDGKLIRPIEVVHDAAMEVSNSYTDVISFVNDYMIMSYNKKIDNQTFIRSMNDLYLISLSLMKDENYEWFKKEGK